jgi:hypothetical protein
MKYRKKPVIIDAEQFDPDNLEQQVRFEKVLFWQMAGYYYYIKTLEGDMIVNKGDWIITGVKGEAYPCKPDIFDMTYELVNQAGDGEHAVKDRKMYVIAKDQKGNEWVKEITFHKGLSGPVISFGSPCEYYVADLMKNYPFNRPLSIDVCGGNHLGTTVDVSPEEINRALEFAAIKCWMFYKAGDKELTL